MASFFGALPEDPMAKGFQQFGAGFSQAISNEIMRKQRQQRFKSDIQAAQQYQANLMGYNAANQANMLDPGFQAQLGGAINADPNRPSPLAPFVGGVQQPPQQPQFQSEAMQRAAMQSEMQKLLNPFAAPQAEATLDLTRAQTAKALTPTATPVSAQLHDAALRQGFAPGTPEYDRITKGVTATQPTAATELAREKFEQDKPKAALDLKIAQETLNEKKRALEEATNPKSIKRLTADADLALKKAQLERAKTLSPEEYRHQFALKQGEPGSDEYKNAMSTTVVQPTRTEIAQAGNKYKVPPGTIMQFKPDGTITFPNKSLIQASKRPGREWYEPLNKSITALDNIKRLKAAMVPGGGGAESVGVKDKIWTTLQKYTGSMPADKSVFYENKAMMYSLIKQTSQESRMSDQDLKFLAAILPSDWQADQNFVAVLDDLETQSQASFNRDYEIISDPSMAIPVPSTYDAYYSGTATRTQADPVQRTGTASQPVTDQERANFGTLTKERQREVLKSMGYSDEDIRKAEGN